MTKQLWQFKESPQRLNDIAREVVSLRRENRFLKVGLIFCLVLSAMPYLTGFQPETISVKQVATERILFLRDGKPFLVVAPHPKDNAIVAVGADMTPVLGIKWTEFGGQIGVYNREGKPIVDIMAWLEGGRMSVRDNNGKTVAALDVVLDEGAIHVDNATGSPTVVLTNGIFGGRIYIYNNAGKSVATISARPLSGKIELTTPSGQTVWSAP
jgi:hypothetical protein